MLLNSNFPVDCLLGFLKFGCYYRTAQVNLDLKTLIDPKEALIDPNLLQMFQTFVIKNINKLDRQKNLYKLPEIKSIYLESINLNFYVRKFVFAFLHQ